MVLTFGRFDECNAKGNETTRQQDNKTTKQQDDNHRPDGSQCRRSRDACRASTICPQKRADEKANEEKEKDIQRKACGTAGGDALHQHKPCSYIARNGGVHRFDGT